MAPALTENPSHAWHEPQLFTYDNPDPKIYPDGIKTSGQMPPDSDKLRPYEDFPKEITGPTAWKAEEYANQPEKWTHRFTDEEIAELSQAADAFLAGKTPLTGISKVRREDVAPQDLGV